MLSLQGFHCFIIYLLRHCSVLGLSYFLFCLLRHNAISSGFPLFYYLLVTSLLCSRLQLFPLLFITSQCYLFRVYIVLLSVCYVTALFSAWIFPSSSFF